MLAAALALVGAMIWGGADFLGGLASKRMTAVRVTLITGLAALVVLLPAQLAIGGVWSWADSGWGAGVGALYALGLVCLYAGFAAGPMIILSPLAAVLSAIVPALWAVLVEGEVLGPLAWVGATCAVVAVVLIARARGEHAARPRALPVLLTVIAGVAFGAFVILLDRTSDASGLTPLIVSRAVLVALTGAAVIGLTMRGRVANAVESADTGRIGGSAGRFHPLISTISAESRTPGFRIALAAGVCDAVANILILLALRSGDLAIVGVLQALYPGGTVLLAALVLRERLAAAQWLGLALALGAAVLFAVS